ncbi:hypothetical protein ACWN8B_03535 [Vagococcus zengguangii]|uniref:Uncharacterized protein n=1 Tax=Vagococcus zengguangii TaxID=2571750 RepID=A0A4D7CUJ3_9ENTE|nr:hypothetical protein [Vagococcus zengguangii]QCI87023.1 hypothetical protein FA707_08615 [Vagococcus zengguangii]
MQGDLAENYQLDVERSVLKRMMQVEQNSNSQMFTLKVTSDYPVKSQTIADVQAIVFKETAS